MKGSPSALMTVLTILVAGALAVLAYFVAIGPQLDAASEAAAAAQEARDYNDLLDTQILAAQAKEKEVPLWRGEIAAIAKDLPPTPEYSDLHRLIVGAVEGQGLPVVSVSYGTPQVVVPAVSTTEEPSEEVTGTTDEATATPEPTEQAEATPTAEATDEGSEDTGGDSVDVAVSFEGLIGIPVTVTTEGNHSALMRVIETLYQQDDRFLTITNIEISRAEDKEVEPKRPATTPNEWTMTITYMAFSLLDAEQSFPDDEIGDSPAFPGEITNPFAPLP